MLRLEDCSNTIGSDHNAKLRFNRNELIATLLLIREKVKSYRRDVTKRINQPHVMGGRDSGTHSTTKRFSNNCQKNENCIIY